MSDTIYIPVATEVEEAVLGAMIIEPESIDDVNIILTPDMFYHPIHRRVFLAIMEMYRSGRSPDLISLNRELSMDLESVGGVMFLSKIAQKVSSASRIVRHALLLKEQYMLRVIQKKASYISENISNKEDSNVVIKQVNDLQEEVSTLLTTQSGGLESVAEIANRALDDASRRQALYESGKPIGITTGLRELNRKIVGWRGGELAIIGGRPGSGKTALMLHLALSAARQGSHVCIYSLEMSDVSLVNRLLLGITGIDHDRFKRGDLEPEDWAELHRAHDILSSLNIYIDSNATVSMEYIATHSRKMRKNGQCDIIFVDYLQLADVSSNSGRNREQDVSAASRKGKLIARELDVPVVMLSQLSRKVEERDDKIPMLSDLRESGSLEQDSDLVIFTYRPAYYNIKEIATETRGVISSHGVGVLYLAKQRDGATGQIMFKHNDSLTRIEDL